MEVLFPMRRNEAGRQPQNSTASIDVIPEGQLLVYKVMAGLETLGTTPIHMLMGSRRVRKLFEQRGIRLRPSSSRRLE